MKSRESLNYEGYDFVNNYYLLNIYVLTKYCAKQIIRITFLNLLNHLKGRLILRLIPISPTLQIRKLNFCDVK